MSSISLGPLKGDVVKPIFHGTADGSDLFVEMDTSALIKLVDGATGENRLAKIETQRAKVRAAAQSLFDSGFLSRDGDTTRIIISAIDLD